MLEVKRLRLGREWNQTELAFHAGLAPSVISEIENDKRDPSARTLRKLAEALEVDVADLFPKVQASLPEFNGQERRASVFAEAMIALADQWLAAVSDPKFNSQKVGGLVDAALDLGDVVYDRVRDLWNALPPEDQHMIIDIGTKTNEVAKRGLERLEEQGSAAEFKRRREKIRERTRQISLRSAETA